MSAWDKVEVDRELFVIINFVLESYEQETKRLRNLCLAFNADASLLMSIPNTSEKYANEIFELLNTQ